MEHSLEPQKSPRPESLPTLLHAPVSPPSSPVSEDPGDVPIGVSPRDFEEVPEATNQDGRERNRVLEHAQSLRVMGIIAWVLGACLLAIALASGASLYLFAYSEVTSVSNRILSEYMEVTSEQFGETMEYSVNIHRLKDYFVQHGNLDLGTTLPTTATLLQYEAYFIRLIRTNYSVGLAPFSSMLGFALPDGRFTSAVYDGSLVTVEACDATVASGSHCTATYSTTTGIYPARSSLLTTVCGTSALDQDWYVGTDPPAGWDPTLTSTEQLRWSSFGGTSSGTEFVPNVSSAYSYWTGQSLNSKWMTTLPITRTLSSGLYHQTGTVGDQGFVISTTEDKDSALVSSSDNASFTVVDSSSRLASGASTHSQIYAGQQEVVSHYGSTAAAVSSSTTNWRSVVEAGGCNILSTYPAVSLLGLYSGQTTMQLLSVTVLEVQQYLWFIPAGMYLSFVFLGVILLGLYLLFRAMRQIGACSMCGALDGRVHPVDCQDGDEPDVDCRNDHCTHTHTVPTLWGKDPNFWVWTTLVIYVAISCILWVLWNTFVANAMASSVGDLTTLLTARLKGNLDSFLLDASYIVDILNIALEVELLPMDVTKHNLMEGPEWAYLMGDLASSEYIRRATFVVADSAWSSQDSDGRQTSSSRASHDETYCQVTKALDGSYTYVLGSEECQKTASLDNSTYVAQNYVEDCSTATLSEELSGSSWFLSATETVKYSLPEEKTLLSSGDEWLMSITLKGFPPNISESGTTTTRGQADDRYYGVWHLELTVSHLADELSNFVAVSESPNMIAFVTDLSGNLVAASDPEVQSWITANNSKINADTCGHTNVMAAVAHFKSEHNGLSSITADDTYVGEDVYSVTPLVLDMYGSGSTVSALLWLSGPRSDFYEQFDIVTSFTFVLLLVVLMWSMLVSGYLLQKMKLFHTIQAGATVESVFDRTDQGLKDEEDRFGNELREVLVAANNIVSRLLEQELYTMGTTPESASQADLREAMDVLRSSTETNLGLSLHGMNLQNLYTMRLEYGANAPITKAAFVVQHPYTTWLLTGVLVLWLQVGVLADRSRASMNLVDSCDVVLLCCLLFHHSSIVAVMGTRLRLGQKVAIGNMVIRSLLLFFITLDLVLAITVTGYWRFGLYLRAGFVVAVNRELQRNFRLLSLSLFKARVILAVFLVFVWIGALCLMLTFMHESNFDSIGITGMGGFKSFYNVCISTFIFTMTGENYTDIVYPAVAIHKEYLILAMGLSMVGLFFLLSLLVASFQENFGAFSDESIRAFEFRKLRGYALVFVMWSTTPGESNDNVETMSMDEFLAFMDKFWPSIQTPNTADRHGDMQINIFAGTQLWERDEDKGQDLQGTEKAASNRNKWRSKTLTEKLHDAAKVAEMDRRMVQSVFKRLDDDGSGQLNIREFENIFHFSKMMKIVSRSWPLSMKLRASAAERALRPLEKRARSEKKIRKRDILREKVKRLKARSGRHARKSIQGSDSTFSKSDISRTIIGASTLILLSVMSCYGSGGSYTWMNTAIDTTVTVMLGIQVAEIIWGVSLAGSARHYLTTAPSRDILLARRIDLFLVSLVIIRATVVVVVRHLVNGEDDWLVYYRTSMLPLLLRIFTSVAEYRRLLFMFANSVAAAKDLIFVLVLILYVASNLGTDLFQGVLEADEISTNVNFDSADNTAIILMQMFVGEGWHEIMYMVVEKTNAAAAVYFVTYIFLVTVLYSQVFVSVVIDMYNRFQRDTDFSLFGDDAATLFEMTGEDHKNLVLMLEEMNEYWWAHNGDLLLLGARSTSQEALIQKEDNPAAVSSNAQN